ncbi:TonB-dependent receptor plug domain-containing protein [Hydrogenimonas thermophila]|uniref:Iron complex outermembrane recepter protein n=1 Tax=Hydrogenimonas thermophila TaxID=223786 RepID=A0A1I5SE81_9BACT|nr:TonB-dependent receptor plug domain-containing protein [Hydrogenimonas thermophila]SFP69013.1 iron complex outermembrane recepter protein [Hydrogenimonas thermophila]
MHKKIKITFFLFMLATIANLFGDDSSIDLLLQEYKKESELSKKTKKETSGILYLYTREMLERMQVKNLKDILKTIPGINLYRAINNISLISTSSNGKFPTSGVRIFINDHDMTSASFGSAFLIWGDLNLEYIDHIEVYKATSSIEFGNETAPIVIKLYTKLANREEGGKARFMLDHKGSSILNLYNAKTVNDDFSYFVYGDFQDIKNKKYNTTYNSKIYTYSSDKQDYNFYANFLYKEWLFETGMINKTVDSFIGIGIYKTPDGSRLYAKQKYAHLTKKFENGFKVQFSADDIDYEQIFVDPNGIYVYGMQQPVTNYTITFDDKIYSITAEQTLSFKNNRLFYGGFYKYKEFYEKSDVLTDYNISNSYQNSYKNSLDYSSLYFEDSYYLTSNISLVGSFKKDFYSYEKDIEKYSKSTYKLAARYKDEKWHFQLLYTHSYLPVTLYQIYNPDRIPYEANKNLVAPTTDILLFFTQYNMENSYINLTMGEHQVKDPIIYNYYPPNQGFINLFGVKSKYNLLELTYHYDFDNNNRFDIVFYDTYNHKPINLSPKWGITAMLFNRYNKFDIYNELVFKSSYDSFGLKIKRSYDWTASVKYHISKDFSIGIRGENILNKGLEQAYNGVPYSIPVVEQKFWLNLEYLF